MGVCIERWARPPLITSTMKIIFTLTTLILLSACAAHQPYTETAAEGHYIVQSGDNFESIAFQLEITPEQLRRANPWANSGSLQAGMRLAIPQSSGQQPFDANGSQTSPTKYIWPLKRFEVSSNFGIRSGRLHSGIDLSAPRDTPIYAAAAGRVKFSGFKSGYGKMVTLDHGRGIETTYAHNNSNLVTAGQRVQQGELIARVGRSGRSTGYHLHFEYRRNGKALDPALHMQAAR
jgi:murein DD-endopeptidase MepM/ murein hydrolase activator NlpD